MVVLTCTHNLCFEQKKEKNITILHMKMIIFTAVKNRSILHGRVFGITGVGAGGVVDILDLSWYPPKCHYEIMPL